MEIREKYVYVFFEHWFWSPTKRKMPVWPLVGALVGCPRNTGSGECVSPFFFFPQSNGIVRQTQRARPQIWHNICSHSTQKFWPWTDHAHKLSANNDAKPIELVCVRHVTDIESALGLGRLRGQVFECVVHGVETAQELFEIFFEWHDFGCHDFEFDICQLLVEKGLVEHELVDLLNHVFADSARGPWRDRPTGHNDPAFVDLFGVVIDQIKLFHQRGFGAFVIRGASRRGTAVVLGFFGVSGAGDVIFVVLSSCVSANVSSRIRGTNMSGSTSTEAELEEGGGAECTDAENGGCELSKNSSSSSSKLQSTAGGNRERFISPH